MYSTPILRVVVLVTVGFATTTFHFLGFVQSATEPGSVKVGVINMQQVTVSTIEGKQALAELQGKFAQRQKDLAILSEQISAVRRRLGAGQTLG